MATNQDEFPYFEDGDVTIVTSTASTYRLHSQTLKMASGFFKDMFESYNPPKLSAAARRDGRTPWHFQLAIQDDVERFGRLLMMQISEGGAIKNKFTVRQPSSDADSDEVDDVWRTVLGIFYGIPPRLDTGSLQALVPSCVKLVTVAVSIAAGYAVRHAVQLALAEQDHLLYQATAKNSAVWIKFAQDIQSPKLFKDVICHTVGKWRMLDAEAKARIPKEIQQLCQRKFDELQLSQRAIELRMGGHYPECLYEQKTREQKDIFAWQALCLFRQFLSQSGVDARNSQADDAGYAWYKALSEGGEAYLDRAALQEFYKAFQFSPSGKRAFEARLAMVKEDIKPFVADMMKRRTHAIRDEEGKDFEWFTCTVVTNEDLPWTHEQETEVSDEEESDTEMEDRGLADQEPAGGC